MTVQYIEPVPVNGALISMEVKPIRFILSIRALEMGYYVSEIHPTHSHIVKN